MPGADQHHQLHFSSSHHERTYMLSKQQCQEQINTISFIPAPVTTRALTSCQAKNSMSRSTPSTSFQLQPPCKNLPAVNPRMPGADQHHQLHSRATIRELTRCHMKNARIRSTPSASFQLQPQGENLPTVKPIRMPGADQHHQLHSWLLQPP
jgi:hypothetical protein